MEVRLHDHSRLMFTWIRPGLLNLELWKPGNRRDGHRWMLQGSTQLAGEELEQFIAAIAGTQKPELLPAA